MKRHIHLRALLFIVVNMCCAATAGSQTLRSSRPASLHLAGIAENSGLQGFRGGCNIGLHKPDSATAPYKFLARSFYLNLTATVFPSQSNTFSTQVSAEMACRFQIQPRCYVQVAAGPYFSQSIQQSGRLKINFRDRSVSHNLQSKQGAGLTYSVGLGREFSLPRKLGFTGFANFHYRQQLWGTGSTHVAAFEIGIFKRIN
ncbi:MAG: hypothetical protein MUC87_01070 [Bacteroidia bacterium]|jgi:hypothetical protein|nr:hypothetical protein [Bacteroidia bacterium]